MERITDQYPEILEAIGASGIPGDTIIEGEVVAFDFKRDRLLPFQALMQRRRKHDVAAFTEKVPAVLFIFDMLLVNGQSLLNQPLSKRRDQLERCVKQARKIRLSKRIITSSFAGVEACFHEALAYGAEGIVIKLADSPYQAGKRGWL